MINVDDVTLKFRPNRKMIPLPIKCILYCDISDQFNVRSNINLDLDQICLLSD